MLTPSDMQYIIPQELTFTAWRPPDSLINLLGLFGTVVIIYWVAFLLMRPKQPSVRERRPMTTPAREAYVKLAISDAVTEAVETLLDQDAITREEAMVWYRRISNAGLPDLLPKGQQLMKAALKAKHPEYNKPKEATTNVVPIKKKTIGQFLRKQ